MNVTQWNVLWSAALLPPQTMFPTDDIFEDISCTSPLTAAHLFGFLPSLDWQTALAPRQEKQPGQEEDRDKPGEASLPVDFVEFV